MGAAEVLIVIIQLLIYLGIAYLAFLGLKTLIQSRKTPKQEPPESKSSTEKAPGTQTPNRAGAGKKNPTRKKRPAK